ncbi:LLM class flavin-dependent oxidoreductase [Pseudonocardia ailaonensis]|uniref:LLM class flavin-dependent oxidoreductase n=1 Tax=Pseudonocardia ailaonensis TaxID=367279 RepID=A0ABN2N399_9PSEU
MDERSVIGIEIDGDGAHPAAWRAAAHAPNTLLTAGRLREVGDRAERAGFGFVTLADVTATAPGTGVAGRFDPLTAAAFLSATTSALGLVPVVHPAHAEPFHVSNQLSSLDHGSRGRAGWLVGTEATPARAAAHGVRHQTDPQLLAAEAEDVVDATRRLWDSWQDDAIVADESTCRFLDADRVHHIDFRGRTFGIRGPALMPRPPQGQVPVLAPPGVLPDRLVDVEIVAAPTEEGLRAAAARARAPKVLAEVEVALGPDPAGVPWPVGERLRHTGSTADLVALLGRLATVVDAVRLVPAVLDRDLPLLAEQVLPALDLRRPAPGGTLRELFDLPRPAGRYAS